MPWQRGCPQREEVPLKKQRFARGTVPPVPEGARERCAYEVIRAYEGIRMRMRGSLAYETAYCLGDTASDS